MTRNVQLTALAETDLIGIWEYTSQQWDITQADKYLDELDQAIGRLADNPSRGTPRDYVRVGYRVVFVNSHAIDYTTTLTTIHIVRVLHNRTDPDKYL